MVPGGRCRAWQRGAGGGQALSGLVRAPRRVAPGPALVRPGRGAAHAGDPALRVRPPRREPLLRRLQDALPGRQGGGSHPDGARDRGPAREGRPRGDLAEGEDRGTPEVRPGRARGIPRDASRGAVGLSPFRAACGGDQESLVGTTQLCGGASRPSVGGRAGGPPAERAGAERAGRGADGARGQREAGQEPTCAGLRPGAGRRGSQLRGGRSARARENPPAGRGMRYGLHWTKVQ